MLAERLAGATEPSGGWDVNIAGRLTQTAAANNITVEAAYYTDICGIPLEADGTGAINVDRTENLAVALQVGNGSHVLPGGTATAPGLPEPARRSRGGRAGHRPQGRRRVRRRRDRHHDVPGQHARDRRRRLPPGLLRRERGQVLRAPAGRVPGQHHRPATAATSRSTPASRGSSTPSTRSRCAIERPGNVGYLDWDPPAAAPARSCARS